MVQPTDYVTTLKKVLQDYMHLTPANGDIATFESFDDDNGQYVLLQSGWQGSKYLHGAFIHVQLKEGKLWIHYDGTESGIANDLVDAGIPNDAIVLGFRHPSMRAYTNFAAA